MDPDSVTVIIEALGAGALAASRETAGRVVTDAYAEMKTVLKRALSRRPHGAATVEDHAALEAREPGSGNRRLIDELAALDLDPAPLLLAAEHLQAAITAGQATYSTHVENSHGVMVGSYNTGTFTFTGAPAAPGPPPSPRSGDHG